jgi:hypothetical protein
MTAGGPVHGDAADAALQYINLSFSLDITIIRANADLGILQQGWLPLVVVTGVPSGSDRTASRSSVFFTYDELPPKK